MQTDTRLLKEGDIFFALRGPRYNGNAFALQALQQGAAVAVIDDPAYDTGDPRLWVTDNALQALQDLARHHRRQCQIPFIAITGSNGKTTTKELILAVLSQSYRCYGTEGNLNNHIGVPLSILRVRPDTEMAVIEMGANHLREIAGYCTVAQPTHGLITNVGKAHLEGFGSLEGVRKGKGELFDYLRQSRGTAFICGDFDYFLEMSAGIPERVWYGTGGNRYLNGHLVAAPPELPGEPFIRVFTDYTGEIPCQLAGAYNVHNVLAAVAVGKYFQVPSARVLEAVSEYCPSNNRSQVSKEGSNTVIMDAYNANPSSMRAAIENMVAQPGDCKVLLLGGMMELGPDSVAEHQALVDLVGQHTWAQVVLVGGDFARVKHPYLFFPDVPAARQWYQAQSFENALILIKGSRSIGMEKILS